MEWRGWRERIERHERAEQFRVASEPWWFSARPQQPWSVTPVFGGTRIGWEALLATLGASVLACGHNLTIANLSEWQVAATLAEFTSARHIPVGHATISAEESSLDLFEGLSSEELISLVLNALATEDPSAHRREHMEDRALLRSIAIQLKPHVSLGRLRSALRILLREAPLADEDAQLSGEEFERPTLNVRPGIRSGANSSGHSCPAEHALHELSFFARLPVTTGDGTKAMAPATSTTGQVPHFCCSERRSRHGDTLNTTWERTCSCSDCSGSSPIKAASVARATCWSPRALTGSTSAPSTGCSRLPRHTVCVSC